MSTTLRNCVVLGDKIECKQIDLSGECEPQSRVKPERKFSLPELHKPIKVMKSILKRELSRLCHTGRVRVIVLILTTGGICAGQSGNNEI